jgi:hypothetical protein
VVQVLCAILRAALHIVRHSAVGSPTDYFSKTPAPVKSAYLACAPVSSGARDVALCIGQLKHTHALAHDPDFQVCAHRSIQTHGYILNRSVQDDPLVYSMVTPSIAWSPRRASPPLGATLSSGVAAGYGTKKELPPNLTLSVYSTISKSTANELQSIEKEP